jgi:hypothetical protein
VITTSFSVEESNKKLLQFCHLALARLRLRRLLASLALLQKNHFHNKDKSITQPNMDDERWGGVE